MRNHSCDWSPRTQIYLISFSCALVWPPSSWAWHWKLSAGHYDHSEKALDIHDFLARPLGCLPRRIACFPEATAAYSATGRSDQAISAFFWQFQMFSNFCRFV